MYSSSPFAYTPTWWEEFLFTLGFDTSEQRMRSYERQLQIDKGKREREFQMAIRKAEYQRKVMRGVAKAMAEEKQGIDPKRLEPYTMLLAQTLKDQKLRSTLLNSCIQMENRLALMRSKHATFTSLKEFATVINNTLGTPKDMQKLAMRIETASCTDEIFMDILGSEYAEGDGIDKEAQSIADDIINEFKIEKIDELPMCPTVKISNNKKEEEGEKEEEEETASPPSTPPPPDPPTLFPFLKV